MRLTEGDLQITFNNGSYDEWEEARRLVERASCPASSRPRSGSATSTGNASSGLAAPVPDWQRQFRLSEFGSDEWFELAQKMFDFTGDNVFVIGTVGEAPNILLTNNDLRNVPTEFPVSNTDWKGKLMYWADQLWLDR